MNTTSNTRSNVVIVGAGPVGLTLALALARQGIHAVLLEGEGGLATGSRAICIARHTLQIWQQLGAAAPMLAKAVNWKRGVTYVGRQPIMETHLPGSDERFPAMVNLSQRDVELALREALARQRFVTLLPAHIVTGLIQNDGGVQLSVNTPAGPRVFEAGYVLATDGARSLVRKLIGMPFAGHTCPDRFVITDIRADLGIPLERHFWFHPAGVQACGVRASTAMIHPQPDGIWRMDWQMGQVDPNAVLADDALHQLIQATVGHLLKGKPYEVVWRSSYVFHQRCAHRFRDRRVFLAGDAAHLMSPFGARGMNSGVQDAWNLAWKLAAVLTSAADDRLLDSYDSERRAAARENLRVAAGTMRFMAPQTMLAKLWQRGVLALGRRTRRAHRFINSSRPSVPHVYAESPLTASGSGSGPQSGAVVADLRLPDGRWLHDAISGRFAVLVVGSARATATPDAITLALPEGSFGLPHGTALLIRPDLHIAVVTPHAADALAWLRGLLGVTLMPARAAHTMVG